MQDIAKEVKATAEIIDTVPKILADASRSAVIEVNNATSRTLRRSRSAHAHGAFAKLPADSIGPFQPDVFGSKSSEGGIATVTTGLIVYGLDDEGTALKISWLVPFVGGNEARAEVTGPNAGFYVCRGEIPGGSRTTGASGTGASCCSIGRTTPTATVRPAADTTPIPSTTCSSICELFVSSSMRSPRVLGLPPVVLVDRRCARPDQVHPRDGGQHSPTRTGTCMLLGTFAARTESLAITDRFCCPGE
ncbi:hypothetical protein [Streptosporangium roseum]|uniref:hypothetical protein n=1 Tax=Streptosporangium roseum TaxID=2001 RepID=UPI0033201592